MKRYLLQIIAISALIVAGAVDANAQCKGFAKKICKPILNPYTHDGNYHAAILTEGEEAELYKTFYSGIDYRIAIVGSDALPEVEFQVEDANKTVLYSNKDHHFNKTWDFRLKNSQQLKIVVKVQSSGKEVSPEEAMSGCVAIMFGIKEKP
jgi:hypothetical protein